MEGTASEPEQTIACTSSSSAVTEDNPNKRPAPNSDDNCAPTTATTVISPSSKRPKPTEEKEEESLDLAITLGYNPGDRIEVQWEIENDGETVVKWWGATLLPFDGRTTDSVAIRTLHYDPCPEMGFPDSSDEDVIFLGDDLLVSPDSTTELHYRREGTGGEGGDDAADHVYCMNEQDMEEQLNAILMGALAKSQSKWATLTPAQQAIIAENIKNKKEQLMSVLKSKKEVITSASIKEILRETFGATA
mmetsp:Transcript_71117/g.206250  ORF Transcript_71117/g.206250 Transcript_71117/m.206250 type:complete len:248 (+) Transcript_71117:76-819(+)